MSSGNDDLTGSKDTITGSSRHKKAAGVSMALAIGIAVILLLVGFGAGYALTSQGVLPGSSSKSTSSSTESYTLTETGSSLIYPYMELLGPNFTKLYPNIKISPASTGSGTGISSAEQGLVDIGGTDAYLLNASNYNLINVPIAISAQLVYYNLPGVNQHLNLNGSVLAMIYQGAITTWNNPLIQAANPGVTLPSQTIIPIHRSDGSGDTFMFTSMCYMSWNGWTGGYGTSHTWPSGQTGANGNSGMVTTLQKTTYGIAYIGISYESEASAAGLQYAALGDQAANVNGTNPSNYILPTTASISQDANLALQNLQPPSVAISLILGGVVGATNLKLGQGGTMPSSQYPTPYPDTNLEYTLITTNPKDTVKEKFVVDFLEWSLTNGGSYVAQVHFLPLTAAVIGYDMQALAAVPVSA